jgi:hypothetical protein
MTGGDRMGRFGMLLALVLIPWSALGGSLSAQESAPSATAGTQADGKAFRILDRIAKDVDGSVIFDGEIAGAIAVGKTSSGALSLCINCAGPKALPTPVDKAGKDVKADEGSTASLGNILVCDASRLWHSRFSGGAYVFLNDSGFDEDGREYEAVPSAGENTRTYRVGNLIIVANRAAESSGPLSPAGPPYEIAVRRQWTTYLAPIAGNQIAPAKVADGDAGGKEARALAKPDFEKEPDWPGRYPTRFLFREGASKGALTNAIALLATSREEFLMVIDLRKLESERASYFWAPYHFGQSVHLDEHSVSVEGEMEDGQVTYAPDTYVEYPYLVIIGKYAKLRLTGAGGEGAVLDVGYCDECP